jgi:transposase
MKITKKHRDVAIALINAKLPKVKIAKEFDITEQTIYNWLKNDDFRKMMEEIAELTKQESVRIAKKFSTEAIRRLMSIVSEEPKDVSAEVIRRACRDLLEMAEIIQRKDLPEDTDKEITVHITEELVKDPPEELAERADRISKRAAKIRDKFSQN